MTATIELDQQQFYINFIYSFNSYKKQKILGTFLKSVRPIAFF